MRLERRQLKAIGRVAGIAAVTVLATVLLLWAIEARDNDTPPDSSVLAIVNGEEITAQDVARLQGRVLRWDATWLETKEVLEQLIAEKLLYLEAAGEDYVPTLEEAETSLLMALADAGMPTEVLYARLDEEGLSYLGFLEDWRVQLAIASFLADEVEVPEVTEAEASEFYEGYKEFSWQQFPDREPPPFEDMRATVFFVLEAQKQQEAVALFIEELRERTDIQYVQSE